MSKNDILTLCLFVLGFSFFGALSNYGITPEDADVFKSLATGAGSGAGLGFVVWFFLMPRG